MSIRNSPPVESRVQIWGWVAVAILTLQLPISVPGQPVYTPYAFRTLAGYPEKNGTNDGVGAEARFGAPHSVAVDSGGWVYVADMTNHVIRKIAPNGEVTTLAGSAGQPGSSDGTGAEARFNGPRGVAVDRTGVVYVADAMNDTIRKITPAGLVGTLAGLAGNSGSVNGTGSVARFSRPGALAVSSNGNIYVTDANNHTVRAITPEGVVATLAGSPGNAGSIDGNGSTARFRTPAGIAVDSSGRVFVSDEYNHTVRMIMPNGDVSTIAGWAGNPGTTDGTGTMAQFHNPHGCAVDRADNLYISEMANHTVRRITPERVVTTIAGTALSSGWTDGKGPDVRFAFPRHTAVDDWGNVYVADFRNYTIRKGWAVGVTPVISIRQISANEDHVLLQFHLITGSGDAFTLLEANDPSGSWSGDKNALCTTNVPGVSYGFTTPKIYPARFFRVQTP